MRIDIFDGICTDRVCECFISSGPRLKTWHFMSKKENKPYASLEMVIDDIFDTAINFSCVHDSNCLSSDLFEIIFATVRLLRLGEIQIDSTVLKRLQEVEGKIHDSVSPPTTKSVGGCYGANEPIVGEGLILCDACGYPFISQCPIFYSEKEIPWPTGINCASGISAICNDDSTAKIKSIFFPDKFGNVKLDTIPTPIIPLLIRDYYKFASEAAASAAIIVPEIKVSTINSADEITLLSSTLYDLRDDISNRIKSAEFSRITEEFNVNTAGCTSCRLNRLKKELYNAFTTAFVKLPVEDRRGIVELIQSHNPNIKSFIRFENLKAIKQTFEEYL